MAIIKLKKGIDLHLKGGSAKKNVANISGNSFAIVPDDFHGIVPRLDVKEGDKVKSGTLLFHDRTYPEIFVTSPISGTIKEICRGERRKIQSIIIENDSSSSSEEFDVSSNPKEILLRSGLWASISQRPYDIVPSPSVRPRDIFVTAFDSAPLAPSFEILLEGKEQYLQKGIDILASLTDGKVFIGLSPKSKDYNLNGCIENIFDGPHPAGNVSVQIANLKPVNKGEVVWCLDLVTVARIGELFTTGKVPFDTVVAVSGSEVKDPHYISCTIGQDLASILKDNVTEPIETKRIISGNVLTGSKSSFEAHLRFPYHQITVIPENQSHDEFMGWASLSPKKFSVYHSFFSWLNMKKERALDAKINGAERAIVMAGEYDKMLPMDIYAEFLIKSIIAFDIDKMEQLGIYEMAPEDFALCEFADTSKLELQKIVREGLDKLRKEME